MEERDYQDGLGTILNNSTGLGTEVYDTALDYNVRFTNLISQDVQRLNELYTKSWACGKVCSYKPIIMVKGWGNFVLEGIAEGELPERISKQEKKKFNRHFNSLKSLYSIGQTFGNLYGNAYYIRYVNDGQDFSQPIDYSKVTEVSYSRIYASNEVRPHYHSYEGNFYDPELYEFYSLISPEELKEAGVDNGSYNNIVIHKDRVLVFSGIFLPPDLFRVNSYQHGSLLERFLDPYTRFTSSMAHTAKAMESFEVYILGIEELFNKIAAGGRDEEAQLSRRLQLFTKYLSSMRGGVKDKDSESIDILSRNFTNIDKILDQLRTEMIAASGLTKPQFYQEHPSGLASTGQSERMAEANDILLCQENQWGKSIYQDMDLLMVIYGIEEDYKWEWQSLYQETPEEKGDRKNKNSNTDRNYYDMGVLTVEDIQQRFTGTEYSDDIHIEKIESSEEITKDSLETFTPEGGLIAESDYAPIDIQSLTDID